MEPDDPPRKHYTTKAREFERVNAQPGTAPKSAITPGIQPGQVDPNDIHSILLQNRAIEQQRAKAFTAPRPSRKSRRKMDYWLMMTAGNLLVAFFVAVGGISAKSLSMGVAGMLLVSLGLTWIMWFVMDAY